MIQNKISERRASKRLGGTRIAALRAYYSREIRAPTAPPWLRAGVVAASVVNCVVYPLQLAFLQPICLRDGTGDWGWAIMYLICDVPLVLYSLRALAAAYLHQKQRRRRRKRWSPAPLVMPLASLLCCIPWDWVREGGAGACLKYGHLTHVFFFLQLFSYASALVNALYPELGKNRAGARFFLLVCTSILILHWYAFSRLLPPSPAFSRLLPPYQAFSNPLPASPTFSGTPASSTSCRRN